MKFYLYLACLALAGALPLHSASLPAPGPADQALRELKTAATPLKPSPTPPGTTRSRAQVEQDQQAQAAAMTEAARKARQFYSAYPDHRGATEARKIEAVSHLRALRAHPANREGDALAVAAAFVASEANSRRDRYIVASMVKQWEVEKKQIRDPALLLAEYEKNAATLYAQYADVPDVYHLFLGLARNAAPARSREMALDLLEKPAPAEVKAEAQAIIDRQDMPGKTFEFQFTTHDGKVFDLAKERGKPVVLYFWSGRGAASATALSHIRTAVSEDARFVGFNLDPDLRAARDAVGADALRGAQSWDPRGVNAPVARQLRVHRIPSVYVFDRSGALQGFGHPSELPGLLAAASK